MSTEILQYTSHLKKNNHSVPILALSSKNRVKRKYNVAIIQNSSCDVVLILKTSIKFKNRNLLFTLP